MLSDIIFLGNDIYDCICSSYMLYKVSLLGGNSLHLDVPTRAMVEEHPNRTANLIFLISY